MKLKIKLNKRFSPYIIAFLSLISLYILLKCTVSYFVMYNLRDLVDDSAKGKVKFSNVSFEPIGLKFTIKGLDFGKEGSLDQLHIKFTLLDLLNKKVRADFDLNDFDLSILNKVPVVKNLDFGNIKGRISSDGFFTFEDGDFNISLDAKVQNLFLYSKDLKLIDYFIKELDVKNIKINMNESFLRVDSSSLDISNLILSIQSKDFDEDKLSKFSKIEISDVNFSLDKKKNNMKGLVNFSNGGFFAFNKYRKASDEILDIKVKGVDLVQFSDAFEPLLNYQISSGKLLMDVKASIDSKKIKGNVKMNFSQLNLDDKNELGQDIENQSLIPLKTAIFLIQDDNGNIELEFGLKGSRDDPNFGMMGILRQGAGSVAISKVSSIIATKAAVKFMPMLVSSIPISPSNVFTFANGAYKIATKARFNDIEFTPLEADIKKISLKGLNEVVNFLQDNNKVKLHICPVASPLEFGDEKVNSQKVLLLANERVESLRSYFKNNNEEGVLNQIIFCRPKISSDSNFGKADISL